MHLWQDIQANHQYDIRLAKNIHQRVDRVFSEHISVRKLKCRLMEQPECAFHVKILAGETLSDTGRVSVQHCVVGHCMARRDILLSVDEGAYP